MASQFPIALCETPSYQPYFPLTAFPPAKAYCLGLSHEGSVQIGQPNCQSERNECTLLSSLQAGDLAFARNVWYVTS